MIRIAICDDEQYFQEEIKKYCEQYFEEKQQNCEIYVYDSAELLIAHETSVDIIFMDIEMKTMSGLVASKKILESGNKKSFIVYVTSHQECVMDAFDINVLDFITKPVSYEKIVRVFKKAEMRSARFMNFCINDEKWVYVYEMVSVEAVEGYTRILFLDQSQIFMRKNLKTWEQELLRYDFFKINKSVLINLQYVKRYTKENRMVYLNGREYCVSRRNAMSFQEAYNTYVEKYVWGKM